MKESLNNSITQLRAAQPLPKRLVEVLNSLLFNLDWAAHSDWDDSTLAAKIIEISIYWRGEDEEKFPALKTLRTLAGDIANGG